MFIKVYKGVWIFPCKTFLTCNVSAPGTGWRILGMPLIWNTASACQPLSDRCLGRCQEKQPHNGNKEITHQPLPIKTRVKGMQSRIQSGKQLEGQGQQSLTCAAGGRRDLGSACERPCWFGGGRWSHCFPLLFKLPAGFPC